MESITVQEKLFKISNAINTQSYESRTLSYEKSVNEFLDLINKYRERIVKTTNKIEFLCSEFESLTWLEEGQKISKNTLEKINETLIKATGLVQLLKKDYATLNKLFRKKGICKEELNNYIDAIRFLAETLDDMDAVFFRLPNNPKFQETMKKLATL